jgi:hypothetical protein
LRRIDRLSHTPPQTGGSRLKNASTCARRSLLAQNRRLCCIDPVSWKTCFAKSNPIVVISFMDASLFAGGF